MRLLRGRPEPGHVESIVEVRAEIVHPADREEDVCAELVGEGVGYSCSGCGFGCGWELP